MQSIPIDTDALPQRLELCARTGAIASTNGFQPRADTNEHPSAPLTTQLFYL